MRCAGCAPFRNSRPPFSRTPNYKLAAEFQRRTLEDLLAELSHSLRYLNETGSDLLAWMLVRFQVENLKVLLRGFLDHAPA